MTRSNSMRSDQGQSTVEFALLLPAFFLLVLIVVQVGLVLRAHLHVTSAAREVARAVAVDDPRSPEVVLAEQSLLDSSRAHLSVERQADHLVEVTIRYEFDTNAPLVGALVPDVTIEASAVMRVEQAELPALPSSDNPPVPTSTTRLP